MVQSARKRSSPRNACRLLLVLSLVIVSCGPDVNAPDPVRPGVPTPGAPFEIQPFDVLRHSANFYGLWRGDQFALTVGGQGAALILAGGHRFRLPTETTCQLLDAFFREGTAFVAGDNEDTGLHSPPTVLRFFDGRVYNVQNAEGIDWYGDARCIVGEGLSYVRVGVDKTIWEYTDPFYWEQLEVNSQPYAFGEVIYGLAGDLVACADGIYKIECGGTAPCKVYESSAPVFAISGLIRQGLPVDSLMAVAGDEILMTTNSNGVYWEVAYSPGFLLRDICWADANWAVAVGAAGLTCIFDGISWQILQLDTDSDLHAVKAWRENGSRRALAVGERGAEYRYENGSWVGHAYTTGKWTDIMGDPSATLYGISDGRLMRYDGEWHTEPLPSMTDLELSKLCCRAADSVWAIGRRSVDNFVVRFNGTSWTTPQWFSSMETPRDIWAGDIGNVFVACDHGTVYSSAGYWAPMNVVQPPQHLRGIWGASPASVYVVGENGTIAHYDGLGWAAMTSGTSVHLNAICGSGDEHVVAVGDAGTILRYDGQNWAAMNAGATVDFTLAWTDGPSNIWAATAAGKIYRFDGAEWSQLSTGFPDNTHNALWGRGEDVWLGGSGDLVLEYLSPAELPSELDLF